ncbi:hypothetical protein [Fictibacillus terranigra]|uniref:Uncharacterized protein n=1 Tax=Fictibacillus terranigra TaxID=3058424 RepID=A0ABT8E8S7_9BACL|nr:hypothetical protein [Fictibacillus sp. CENA-BCM004]MDN4074323.1 hypothetical protein [Fictibacillus sp. CENA-BCM004]
MNEVLFDANELFGVEEKKSVYTVVNNVRNLQAQAGEKLLRIGEELAYAKENGFFDEALGSLDLSNRDGHRFLQCYKRFGRNASHSCLPDSKLYELVQFPEDIPSERLVEYGEMMNRQQLRELKAQLKGTKPKRAIDDIERARKVLDKLTDEEIKQLLNEYRGKLK